MVTDIELKEVDMLESGVPSERAVAEVWIVHEMLRGTAAATSLDYDKPDAVEKERRRAWANLIAAVLVAARGGLTLAQVQGEVNAAPAEVFAADGSIRDLEGSYGWRPKAGYQ